MYMQEKSRKIEAETVESPCTSSWTVSVHKGTPANDAFGTEQ